ncbi:MAG TPA: hypothetical protein VGV59_11885 [Pyrinomonadaceae bacterium]|nr:hypothetical protein [Pyrinomonadaceae bacterium]
MTRKLIRLACACLLASVCALSADAQEERPDVNAQAREATTRQSASSAEADENFDLDIGERRITEENYQASLSVALGAEAGRGLDLRVGVAVGAASIDVLLRNVRGRVRFRATLGQVLRLLNERRAGGLALPAPLPTSSP